MNNIEPKPLYHGAMTQEEKKIRELSFPIPFESILVMHPQFLLLLTLSPSEEDVILAKLKEEWKLSFCCSQGILSNDLQKVAMNMFSQISSQSPSQNLYDYVLLEVHFKLELPKEIK